MKSLNFSRRKVLKSRGAPPTDDSILKVLYLGMQRIPKKWTKPILDWKWTLNQLSILLGDRVPTRQPLISYTVNVTGHGLGLFCQLSCRFLQETLSPGRKGKLTITTHLHLERTN